MSITLNDCIEYLESLSFCNVNHISTQGNIINLTALDEEDDKRKEIEFEQIGNEVYINCLQHGRWIILEKLCLED